MKKSLLLVFLLMLVGCSSPRDQRIIQSCFEMAKSRIQNPESMYIIRSKVEELDRVYDVRVYSSAKDKEGNPLAYVTSCIIDYDFSVIAYGTRLQGLQINK